MLATLHPRLLRALALALGLAASAAALAADTPAFQPAPQAFRQEYALRFLPSPGTCPEGLKLVLVDEAGTALTSDGATWFKAAGSGRFDEPPGTLEPRSAPAGLKPGAGWLELGAKPLTLPVPLAAVRQVCVTRAGGWLATTNGAWRVTSDGAAKQELPGQDVRQVAAISADALLAATRSGLFQRGAKGDWEIVPVADERGGDWTASELRAVAVAADGTWWVAFADRVASRRDGRWRFFTGREGLPVGNFTCAAAGHDGSIWFGTRRGAVRFDGTDWAYREGPRWLPGNDVRALAADASGRVWFATDQGLGCIAEMPMTLAEKAAMYEREVERYIKRTPLGYTSEVGLGAPGVRADIQYSDSDNDGLWTAMYGAGECFAYAATKQPEARQRATQAFEALRFLQKVTQGGPHSPPKGFVARSIRPVEWLDPNIGGLEHDRRKQESDRLWKIYAPRWPKSADGKWYWKSDTSSDELDGHFFFYAAYFDHVAETDAEKERVREVVRDLADHLVTHDFCLVDHDGQPTRWGVFGPQYLNHDPRWWVERGINSLSILSYLAVAEHVTGDAKYGAAARELIDKHGYGANVMNPKTQLGVGGGNQSDDEMAFMCFYNLLRYTKDTAWRNKWQFAFYAYWTMEEPELNPFFNFAYAASGLGQTYTNAYGTISLAPWPGWLADAMATLRGFPLDRVNWPQQNRHRLDVQLLRRQETEDLASDEPLRRGFRVNGKVLPVAERHFGHWNTDPWELNYGGDGRELASGTVYLLPYYLGLYQGFIQKPN